MVDPIAVRRRSVTSRFMTTTQSTTSASASAWVRVSQALRTTSRRSPSSQARNTSARADRPTGWGGARPSPAPSPSSRPTAFMSRPWLDLVVARARSEASSRSSSASRRSSSGPPWPL